jgi:hypothetical protein
MIHIAITAMAIVAVTAAIFGVDSYVLKTDDAYSRAYGAIAWSILLSAFLRCSS